MALVKLEYTNLQRLNRNEGLVNATQRAQTSGYPASKAAMRAAVGYGEWDVGYLCSEASGALYSAFGSPGELYPVEVDIDYRTAGPLGGTDYAVSLNGAGAFNYFYARAWASQFVKSSDLATMNLTGEDDLIVAWVARIPASAPTAYSFIGKRGTETTNWHVQIGSGAGGALQLLLNSGGITYTASAAHASNLGGWHCGIAAFDRANSKMRVCTTHVDGSIVAAAPGDCSNVAIFGIGRTSSASPDIDISAVWAGVGPGKAHNLVENMPAALDSLIAYIGL